MYQSIPIIWKIHHKLCDGEFDINSAAFGALAPWIGFS